MDTKTAQVYLGLLLATACTALVRESDVIWFPVDEQDGVFVSSYGQKYRTSWNSRRARFSEDYDSPKSKKQLYDFEEIRELLANPKLNEIIARRPKSTVSKSRRNVRVSAMNDVDEIVPIGARYRFILKNQPTERPKKFIQIPYRRPNRNGKQDISEIFDVHRPTTETYEGNSWPSPFPESKPVTEETWEPKPPTDDKVIFPAEEEDEDDNESGLSVTTESPNQLQPTTQSDCERSCQVTPEFNPVCGSDFNNYSNIGRLKCAQMCGRRVQLLHHGNCGRSREIRPPAQHNSRLIWS